MNILAFDTSTDTLAAGVYRDGLTLAEEQVFGFARHSETLTPVLRKLLKISRVALSDLDLIAVGMGPGSFTGLRVGLTTAKVLAFAAKKKIVGIPSTEILALSQGIADGPLAVFLDAKKNRIYLAVYGLKGESLSVLQTPLLVSAEKWPTILKRLKQKGCRILSELKAPRASCIASIAARLAAKRKFSDPKTLKPLYLHPKDCNATPPPV